MSSEFLCQDLEAKLFNWFAGRLDASIIKRSNEMTVTLTEEQVGDIIDWLDYGIDGICHDENDEKNDAQVEKLQAIRSLLLDALEGDNK